MNTSSFERNRKGFTLITLMVMMFSFLSPVVFADTLASQGSTFTSLFTGRVSWDDPTKTVGSDNSRAKAILNTTNTLSEDLRMSNFKFNIPLGATIEGIQVAVEHSASVANVIRTKSIQLRKGLVAGVPFNGEGTSFDWGLTDTVTLYGGANDLWGDTWIPQQINAQNFGVDIIAQHGPSGPPAEARIDHIAVTVYYTPDTTNPVISEVTAVSSLTNDATPEYSFTSSEAGTIQYGGSCHSSTTAAVTGLNVVSFNALAEGTYSDCTISLADAASNTSNTLNIGTFTVDTTPPVITIDPYNTAPTNTDVVVNAATNEGTLNATTYTFTSNGSFVFTAIDSAGNVTNSPVTVSNIDKSAPVITLNGSSPMDVSFGTAYSEPGAICLDNVDPVCSVSVDNSAVNTGVLGIYSVYYDAVDTVGNAAPQVIRTVNVVDIDKPVITLLGTATTTVAQGSVYTDAGATAVDNVDGDITGNIIVTGSVDTSTLGNYILSYDVSDAALNAATQVTRTVTVADQAAPSITEVTPVPTPGTNHTPSYTFSTNEAGTISYGESTCQSSTTTAVVGNNTITFNTLPDGTYANCTITVTDTTGNVSNVLAITPFTIDTMPPVLTETTPVPTPTNTHTPSYTFSTDEAGTLSYGESLCQSTTTAATTGANTIVFNSLPDGTYAECAITLTDAAGNTTPIFPVSAFTIDTVAPLVGEEVAVPSSTNHTPNYTFAADEAGIISYGGSCNSANTNAIIGLNTITLNTLADGTYSDCTLTVTDAAGNPSNLLTFSSFTISTASSGGGGGGGGVPPLRVRATATDTTVAPETTDIPPVETDTPTDTPESTTPPSPENTGETGGVTTPPSGQTGNTFLALSGQGGANTGGTPSFNPADGTLDIGGGVTPEADTTDEGAAANTAFNPSDGTLDIGGGAVDEDGTSPTLLLSLLGSLGLLGLWWWASLAKKRKRN